MLFKKDDLVFAKIKGYKPWPGRILELKPGNKAMVFFFGTYDKGQVLMKDMWLYNEESKAKYAPAKGKRPKKFQQALEEIVDWPDMLPYEGKSEEKHLDDSLEPDGIEPVEKKQRRDSEVFNCLKYYVIAVYLPLLILEMLSFFRFLTENYGLK